MKPDPIDDLLAKAANRPPDDAALAAGVRRAQDAILGDLRRVRPLGSVTRSALLFLIVFALAAMVAGVLLGPYGFHVLSVVDRAFIFSTLLAVAVVTSVASARSMRPAAGPKRGSEAFLLAAIGFPLLFALLFRGYSTIHLVHEGIPCLVAGVCVALPTGLLLLLLLRRGSVLDRSEAALACGTLAGLAGLAMLEIHCPNLKAIHVIVWHVAVVVVSAALAWVVARFVSRSSVQ